MTESLLRQRDREARHAAQTRFDVPLVLQAGAGTGKTTALISRLLAWTLGAGWERALQRLSERSSGLFDGGETPVPDRVAAEVLGRLVAITFTEAAAAEMGSRAARELTRLATGKEVPGWLDAAVLPPPPQRSARAKALLAALDHLSVRTIHAYCLGLLCRHPLEAEVHPELAVDAEGQLVEEVVRETVEDALREAYGDPGDPDLLALASRGCGPLEIVATLTVLVTLGLPASALEEDPFSCERRRHLRDRLRRACRDVHGLLAPRLRGARTRNARAIEQGLAALIDRLDGEETGTAEFAERLAESFPDNLLRHLRDWRHGPQGDAEAELLHDVQEELAVASGVLAGMFDHLGQLDRELLDNGRRALIPLLSRIEGELQSRGIATFEFLLRRAESLLARRPGVRRQVRRSIDQLLVDEFQDTDRVQCEILRWIALEGPEEERPGLFLVGDPKQSIYGWRNADLRAYDDFVFQVRQAGGEVMSLAENFRSVPAILGEVARVIAPVMQERPGLQPAFEPLLACERRRADSGFVRGGQGGWAAVEHWISWRDDAERGGGRTPAVDAAEIEAAALAADIRVLHEAHGVAWREIALLLRSTGDLDLYLEGLRRARVPFLVGRDKHYYRRREVIEAAALVRAVLDPGDHLALLTVLRSSLAGVPDAALIPLWNRQFPRLMTELRGPSPTALGALREVIEKAARAVPRDVPGIERVGGWEKNLLAAVEHLAELRRCFESEPADTFVERLRRLTLIEAVEAARYLGLYRLANLERFFRQLLAAMEDGRGDVTAILRALRRSVAEAREAEEGRPQEGAEDAVHVLTLHGAKGLDFEHVYLPQLHKVSPADCSPRTAAGRVGERWEYRLFGASTLSFDRIEAERHETEAAERVRLLYVGMTRAKDRLVLAGVWPEEVSPRPAGRARSHMDLLLCRRDLPAGLAGRWREARGTAARAGWSFPDATGALWKFIALRPAGEARLAAEPARPSLPGPEEIALLSSLLRSERERARIRMARPFGGTASEEAHALLHERQAGPQGARQASQVDRAAAMAAGGAVHRALEEWDLAADPREELRRQRRLLAAYLAALPGGEKLDQALPLAESLLEAFGRGPLLDRFTCLASHVLARELPVLLPPGDGDGAPVGVVSGAVDLLYRDPGDGGIVVADYKTDAVDGDEDIAGRAAAYSPQGKTYARAVQEALGLAHAPRFELWFLRAGRVVQASALRG